MKNNVLTQALLAIGICLVLPGVSQALEVDVYGGFGVGTTTQRNTSNDMTSDTAEKYYIGSRFLGPLGIELSYHDLGRYNNATEEVKGVSAVALANLDIRGMTLYAKGGVTRWSQTDLPTGTKIRGEDVTYGFGINLPVDRHVLVRTEIERFTNVGKNDTSGAPGTDISMLSFGLNFTF